MFGANGLRIALALAALGTLLVGFGSTRARDRADDPTRAARLPAASGIRVPHGFRAEIWATGVPHVTAMAFGPDGRLYATEDNGALVALRPGSRGGRWLGSFRIPLGLVWRGDTVYVSGQGVLVRARLRGGRLVERRTLVSGLPYGRHQQDNVVFGRDGRLYFGSGSTCDVCRERDPRSATILSVRPDGRDLRIVARGLRNPYGLAVQPRTGRLYATVNGQDELGTDARPEPAETVVAVGRGAFYGWPRCWPSYHRKRLIGDCRGVTPPVAYLEPHSSADVIVFYDGSSFPRRYRGNIFVAEWGEFYGRRFGRELVRVVLRRGAPAGVSVFARGFAHPLALVVDRHGALLVSDWERGVIYRIQARGKR